MSPSWYTYPVRWAAVIRVAPARATSDRPASRFWHARWTATSPVEHAV
ncbi:hypothetical protein COSO111634_27455 [Corallococcus soli]